MPKNIAQIRVHKRRPISLAMLMKDSGKTFETNLLSKANIGKDQLDDLELDGQITLRILDRIAWDQYLNCRGTQGDACPHRD